MTGLDRLQPTAAQLLVLLVVGCTVQVPSLAWGESTPPPDQAVAQLNDWRARVGVGVITIDDENTEGCRRHAQYYAANGTKGHDEDRGRPGYTAEGDRAARSSVLHYGNLDGAYAWEWAIYHRTSLLNPRLAAAGYWGEHGIACMGVSNIDHGRTSNTLTVHPYPIDGQQQVPPNFGCNESPNPCESIPGNGGRKPIGQPLSVQFNGPWQSANPTVSAASLVADDQPPEALTVEDASSARAGNLDGGIALLPHLRLIPGAWYTAHIMGAVSDHPFDHTWRFRTEGSRDAASQVFDALYPTGHVIVTSRSPAPMSFSVGDLAAAETTSPHEVRSDQWSAEVTLAFPGGRTRVCVAQSVSRYTLAGRTCRDVETLRPGERPKLEIVEVTKRGYGSRVRLRVPRLLQRRSATVVARDGAGQRHRRIITLRAPSMRIRLEKVFRPRSIRISGKPLRYGPQAVPVTAATWQAAS